MHQPLHIYTLRKFSKNTLWYIHTKITMTNWPSNVLLIFDYKILTFTQKVKSYANIGPKVINVARKSLDYCQRWRIGRRTSYSFDNSCDQAPEFFFLLSEHKQPNYEVSPRQENKQIMHEAFHSIYCCSLWCHCDLKA